jgi:hypothetical protein
MSGAERLVEAAAGPRGEDKLDITRTVDASEVRSVARSAGCTREYTTRGSSFLVLLGCASSPPRLPPSCFHVPTRLEASRAWSPGAKKDRRGRGTKQVAGGDFRVQPAFPCAAAPPQLAAPAHHHAARSATHARPSTAALHTHRLARLAASGSSALQPLHALRAPWQDAGCSAAPAAAAPRRPCACAWQPCAPASPASPPRAAHHRRCGW